MGFMRVCWVAGFRNYDDPTVVRDLECRTVQERMQTPIQCFYWLSQDLFLLFVLSCFVLRGS